jgi:NAD(P)-dependent dehydrogenase (short-subunit alcohol dehydrogenase family)
MMPEREIGTRSFGIEDQQQFARVSCDFNPMHLDPVEARRLLTGRPVVHGIHVLLTALELWDGDPGSILVSVSCRFDSPVNVGDLVRFSLLEKEPHHFEIVAAVDGLVCARVGLMSRPNALASEAGHIVPSVEPSETVLDALRDPMDLPGEDHVGKTYVVRATEVPVEFLPRARAHLGLCGLRATVSLSYFVGMVCPGLHSVFSSASFDVNTTNLHGDTTAYSVVKFDARFGLAVVRISGCINGELRAFVRAKPKAQAAMAEILHQVRPREFCGTRVLVIGGSRGLGEVTAKLVAAGGGNVDITYAVGDRDANRIAEQINASGPSICRTWKLDLTTDAFDSTEIPWGAYDAVYYFPTPRIFRKKSEVFERSVFHQFHHFYVDSFYELCALLERTIVDGRIQVFLPSTVAIDERPKGLAEYAMVKAAAEILAQDINRSFSHVTVTSTRLPRLDTDQTSTIMKVATESNIGTLIPFIRSIYAAGLVSRTGAA